MATKTKGKRKTKTSTRRDLKAATNGARKRVKYEDTQKIKVVAEHNRRKGSRYYAGYELMKTVGSVGNFRKKRPDDASELLLNAQKDGYAKVV
jgi:hypothetical protein